MVFGLDLLITMVIHQIKCSAKIFLMIDGLLTLHKFRKQMTPEVNTKILFKLQNIKIDLKTLVF